MYATVQELVDALTLEEKAGLWHRRGGPAAGPSGAAGQRPAQSGICRGRLLSVGVRGGSVV